MRFSSTETTNRINIILAEINVWKNNPILGVGPGMAKYYSLDILGFYSAAHTEYTRILAEHGIPGIFAILIFLIIGIKAFLKTPEGLPKAWMAALMVWPMVEMTHSAMRIAAIGFVFGLAVAQWRPLDIHVPITPNHENSSNR
jgi:O-antigen ligase